MAKPAWAYLRVSTEDQAEISPDAQLREIKEEAAKLGYAIVREFLEPGESAKTDKRPAFQDMIASAKYTAKTGIDKPDAIFVHKGDRFARNREDAIIYKRLLRRDLKIEVIAAREQFQDGPVGSMIEGILEVIAEYYSLNLAQEVVRGMKEKALNGGNLTRPAYGYFIPEARAELEINDDEANIVRIIFDLYVNKNYGHRKIAVHLNEVLQVLQPIRIGKKGKNKGKPIGGNPWNAQRIKYILDNPLYVGLRRWNKHDSSDGYAVKDEGDWIIQKGTHPAIIDTETWERSQAIFSTRKRLCFGNGTVSKYLLSGLLRCGYCGGSMSVIHNGIYIRCNNYGDGSSKCRTSRSYKRDQVESTIIKNIGEVSRCEKEIDFVVPDRPEINMERELLMKELTGIPEALKRVKDAYRKGIDTIEEYGENKKEILEREQEINVLLAEKKDPAIDRQEVIRIYTNLYDLLRSDAEIQLKKQALQKHINRIYLSKEKWDVEFILPNMMQEGQRSLP